MIKKEKKGMLYLYSALMIMFFILSNYIVKFSFEINSTVLYYSVFTIPFIYLFTCLLYKKYGFKKTLIAIIIGVLLQLAIFLIKWLIWKDINTGVLVGTMLSVPFAQLISIGLYKIIKSKFENIISIFAILAIAVIFDNLVFLSVLRAFGDSAVAINMVTISNLIKIGLAFISSLIFVKVK